MKKGKLVYIDLENSTRKKVLYGGTQPRHGVFEYPDEEKIIDSYLAKGYELKMWHFHPYGGVSYYFEKDEPETSKKDETKNLKKNETKDLESDDDSFADLLRLFE